ncbi:uncharacterized protein LOC115227070 [Octopus sinensis]|uniref:Uncharacterized protein LOC115227070 n=1 Tax=Octopus sinensis TaxID=2607531 RepID=A0A6P7TVB9_9MOLL|nr:uncharacterized protein LOC115227070 [Octopus sinensis]
MEKTNNRSESTFKNALKKLRRHLNIENHADLCNRERPPKDIKAVVVATLEDHAPSLSTVQKWAAEFRRGTDSLKKDPRSERTSTSTTEENIDRVHHTVKSDRQLTINQKANVISISFERIEKILHNELSMTMVFAPWLPRL